MEVDLDTFHKQVTKFRDDCDNLEPNFEIRADKFAEFDPFNTIPPALLNAGQLASYAIGTGMIEPFEHQKLTKPATYLVAVEGACRYRDENNDVVSFYLSADPELRKKHLDVRDKVRLAPNSVCFLTLEPYFRMPPYIGARFNLLIRDVYRGLLVGTGPLVDPGFNGRLSIPIHNFTDKEYWIKANEGLVYFEFTKIGWKNKRYARSPISGYPTPVEDQPPFPASKQNRKGLDDYLDAATGSGPPASSIGITLEAVNGEIGRARTFLRNFSLAGFVGGAVLILSAWTLYAASIGIFDDKQEYLDEKDIQLKTEIDDLRLRLEATERKVSSYN